MLIPFRVTLRSHINCNRTAPSGGKGRSENNLATYSQITLGKHSLHELLISLLFWLVTWSRIEAKSDITCLRWLREPKLEPSDAYKDGRKYVEDFLFGDTL